jgi:hypothetical protein
MKIRNKYCILSLSLLLSFSLVLPNCCHADISELFSHNQEMSSDMMHGQHQDAQQCDCGHDFVKDYQKTKKVVNSQNWSFGDAVALSDLFKLPARIHFPLKPISTQPGLLDDSGPALHVLISVFLN